MRSAAADKLQMGSAYSSGHGRFAQGGPGALGCTTSTSLVWCCALSVNFLGCFLLQCSVSHPVSCAGKWLGQLQEGQVATMCVFVVVDLIIFDLPMLSLLRLLLLLLLSLLVLLLLSWWRQLHTGESKSDGHMQLY